MTGSQRARPWSIHGSKNWPSRSSWWKTNMPEAWHSKAWERHLPTPFLSIVNIPMMTWSAMVLNLRSEVQTSSNHKKPSSPTKRKTMKKLWVSRPKNYRIWPMAATTSNSRRSWAELASHQIQTTLIMHSSCLWSRVKAIMLRTWLTHMCWTTCTKTTTMETSWT